MVCCFSLKLFSFLLYRDSQMRRRRWSSREWLWKNSAESRENSRLFRYVPNALVTMSMFSVPQFVLNVVIITDSMSYSQSTANLTSKTGDHIDGINCKLIDQIRAYGCTGWRGTEWDSRYWSYCKLTLHLSYSRSMSRVYQKRRKYLHVMQSLK